MRLLVTPTFESTVKKLHCQQEAELDRNARQTLSFRAGKDSADGKKPSYGWVLVWGLLLFDVLPDDFNRRTAP